MLLKNFLIKFALLKTQLFLTLFTLCTALTSQPTWAGNNLPTFKPTESGLQFTLHGSNTIGAHLGPALIEAFFRSKGLTQVTTLPTGENEYRISGQLPGNGSNSVAFYADIAAHGSSTGFKSLHAGNADIAMSSRLIKSSEIEQLAATGNFKSFRAEQVIGIDGLAVIVNPSNPIAQLSVEQIAKIFTGEIQNWRELGGHEGSINIYARDNQSGTWDTFKSLVLEKYGSLTATAKRFESNDVLSSQVAQDANAIGFVGLASVNKATALAVFDTGTAALRPTVASVATEDYPLSRRLFLYATDQWRKPVIDEFLAFVQGDAGQQQVANTGFIAQTPIAIPAGTERDGPAEYLSLTANAARLSVNVRFNMGSAELDNKAQQDILRVARYMERAENHDKNLLLIGFGDEKLSPQRAQVLSKLRAITVKSALYEQHVLALPVTGFGAYLPVADNAGASRLKNQRVEIWLLPPNETAATW